MFDLFFHSILSVDITNYGENAGGNITVEVNINLNFESVDLIMIGLSQIKILQNGQYATHKNVTDENRVSLSKPFILKSFCYSSSMFMILIKLGRSEHDQIQWK